MTSQLLYSVNILELGETRLISIFIVDHWRENYCGLTTNRRKCCLFMFISWWLKYLLRQAKLLMLTAENDGRPAKLLTRRRGRQYGWHYSGELNAVMFICGMKLWWRNDVR
jgi:hypothetical protein